MADSNRRQGRSHVGENHLLIPQRPITRYTRWKPNTEKSEKKSSYNERNKPKLT